MKIDTVVIIGATGTVGKTVSALFASFGNCNVYMVGRNKDKLNNIKYESSLTVKSIDIEKRLFPVSINNLSKVLPKADLVYESVIEDIDIKKEIHNIINKYVNNNCIVATGTSSLSINELANCYNDEHKKNFLGIHFFNPPYNMSLCEIIPSNYNNKELINNLNNYLCNTLIRDTIIVSDNPGFLANRIGFMMMNEALSLGEEYSIDYINYVIGKYTGRTMNIIDTIDFIGLDIYKRIINNIYNNVINEDKELFKLPKYINKIKDNTIYKITNNDKYVYDIKKNNYRKVKEYDYSHINEVIKLFKDGNYQEGFNYIKENNNKEFNIIIKFLLKYIIYSLKVSMEVCNDISLCDNAMVNGFNWISPLSLIELLGGSKETNSLCNKYLNKDYSNLLKNIPKSKFDYRRFLIAKVSD